MLIAPLHVAGDDPLQLPAGQSFVRYDHASFGGRQASRFLREQHLTVRGALDEVEVIVRLVENGMGVSLVLRAGLWLPRPTRLRVIALLHRAQRPSALDCLLSCPETSDRPRFSWP